MNIFFCIGFVWGRGGFHTSRVSPMMSSLHHALIPSNALCRLLRGCNAWYEVMVGLLLFTTPLVISTDYDLVYTAEVGPPLHSQHVCGVYWSS